VWQALPTDLESEHLVARLDDASLPGGTYLLRARSTDHAGNESSTDRRVDGQQMILSLPLRAVARLEAGIAIVTGRRHRVTRLRPAARMRFGRPVRIAGRLTSPDGSGIPGADVQVLARSAAAAEHPVQLVRTGADGRFEYTTTADSTRIVRFLHAGTPTLLPANAEVTLTVPAATTARVRPRHLRNGHSVTFSGRLRGLPPPPGGKLIELQVRFPNGWQTFRTIRTDTEGRWSARYRFTRTRGTVRYRFRARLPREAGYPFETGRSRSVIVRVRGTR
jgi:5-hydroxyisourate hydrolase-like protein (transthyretin family)